MCRVGSGCRHAGGTNFLVYCPPPTMHTEEAKYCICMYLLITKGKNFELHKHTPAFKRQQNTSTKGKKIGAGSTNADG